MIQNDSVSKHPLMRKPKEKQVFPDQQRCSLCSEKCSFKNHSSSSMFSFSLCWAYFIFPFGLKAQPYSSDSKLYLINNAGMLCERSTPDPSSHVVRGQLALKTLKNSLPVSSTLGLNDPHIWHAEIEEFPNPLSCFVPHYDESVTIVSHISMLAHDKHSRHLCTFLPSGSPRIATAKGIEGAGKLLHPALCH